MLNFPANTGDSSTVGRQGRTQRFTIRAGKSISMPHSAWDAVARICTQSVVESFLAPRRTWGSLVLLGKIIVMRSADGVSEAAPHL